MVREGDRNGDVLILTNWLTWIRHVGDDESGSCHQAGRLETQSRIYSHLKQSWDIIFFPPGNFSFFLKTFKRFNDAQYIIKRNLYLKSTDCRC